MATVLTISAIYGEDKVDQAVWLLGEFGPHLSLNSKINKLPK